MSRPPQAAGERPSEAVLAAFGGAARPVLLRRRPAAHLAVR